MSQRGLKSICSPFQWQLKTETLYHCCSVAKLWLTFRSHGLCNCGTSGSSVFCCLLEFAQIHVHWVSDAISPSHPLLPFSFAYNQHQFFHQSFPISQLFVSDGQRIGVSALVSVLPMNIQDLFILGLTGLISLQSKGFSRVFSSTTVWKHQSFSYQSP